MAGTPKAGRVSTVEIATALTPLVIYAAVAGSKNENLDVAVNMIDVTSKDDLGFKNFIAGTAGLTMTLDLVYKEEDPAQQKIMAMVFDKSKSKVRFYPWGVSVGADQYEADVLVTSMGLSSPEDDAITMSISLQLSGAINIAVQ